MHQISLLLYVIIICSLLVYNQISGHYGDFWLAYLLKEEVKKSLEMLCRGRSVLRRGTFATRCTSSKKSAIMF